MLAILDIVSRKIIIENTERVERYWETALRKAIDRGIFLGIMCLNYS